MILPKSEASTERPEDREKSRIRNEMMKVRTLNTSFELLCSAMPKVHKLVVFPVISNNNILLLKASWVRFLLPVTKTKNTCKMCGICLFHNKWSLNFRHISSTMLRKVEFYIRWDHKNLILFSHFLKKLRPGVIKVFLTIKLLFICISRIRI